jgi:hypothetical protein
MNAPDAKALSTAVFDFTEVHKTADLQRLEIKFDISRNECIIERVAEY